MTSKKRAIAVAELFASTAEVIHKLGYGTDLTPAQWAALRYFATTNPTAADLVSFARHHGTTKGSASQTISRLVDTGLLSRRKDPDDLRRRVIEVTATGRELLKSDPIKSLATLLSTIDQRTLEDVAAVSMKILRHHFETRQPEHGSKSKRNR